MKLKTLEFKDCSADDPSFRQTLDEHEQELERTSGDIKQLIKHCTDVIAASLALSRCQKQLAECLNAFSFEAIDQSQTEDERVICDSLRVFGRIISDIEEARSKIMTSAMDQFVKPLEDFRHNQIGSVKVERKKFEKESRGFYQAEEKHLSLSGKSDENTLREADAALQLQRRQFVHASLGYVKAIQEVHERKKFEFVETLWSFLYSWMQFYRLSFDIAKEAEPYMKDLQLRVQKTRDNFEAFCTESDVLMKKIKPEDNFGSVIMAGGNQISGFVYLMEKKAFAKPWVKRYCTYDRRVKKLTMIPFSHVHGRITGPVETLTVKSCSRRAGDSIEKRFCFDLTTEERNGVLTFQALSEQDRSRWLDIMDGKEPVYQAPGKVSKEPEYASELNAEGFRFVTACMEFVEQRGLSEQGLYRVAGVSSKVSRFIRAFFEHDGTSDRADWDIRTVTSAMKTFLRSLPEPLMTFGLHSHFIDAAKREKKVDRVRAVHELVKRLPDSNYRMLELLIRHLSRVAGNCARNLMTVANLGVCFGPTLMRPEEESVAALVDIKFCNIVVEVLIENWQQIFLSSPPGKPQPKDKAPTGSLTSVRHLPAIAAAQSTDNLHVTLRPAESRPGNIPRELAKLHRFSGTGDSDTLRLTHFFQPGPSLGVANNSASVYYSVPLDSGFSSADLEERGLVDKERRPSSSSPPGGNGNGSVGRARGDTVVSRMPSAPPYSAGPYSHSQMEMPTVTDRISQRPKTEDLSRRDGNNPARASDRNGNWTAQKGPLYSPIEPPAQIRPTVSVAPLVASRISTFQLPSQGFSNDKTPPPPQQPTKAPVKPAQSQSKNDTDVSPKKPANDSKGNFGGGKQKNGSVSDRWNPNRTARQGPGRRVRALYQCKGDLDSELSFEPGEIIINVFPSDEPKWLYGELKGRKGLIPENYVEDWPMN